MYRLFFIPLLFVIAFLFSACTTTEYKKQVWDQDGKVLLETTVDHMSMGMEREGVDLSLERCPDGQQKCDMKATVKVGRSSGKESMDRVITGMENTLSTLKSMRP